MRVIQLEIENFRGISSATIKFGKRTLLVGPNNMGKTTVLEALDLVLGPDRARGPESIEEHDFYLGEYVEDLGASPGEEDEGVQGSGRTIKIEAVLGDLTSEERSRFRRHIEPWHHESSEVYSSEDLEDYRPTAEEFVLRVGFRGWYDPEEDEFCTKTYYLSPSGDDGELEDFGRTDKRQVGFLYLRSLRTASRAASLQRGSLLDILLQLRDARPRMWAALIRELQGLGVSVGQDPNVRAVLQDLETSLGKYLPRQRPTPPSSQLHVSQLTRAHLRNFIVYFLESHSGDYLLPFQRTGTGVTNLLVLALLGLIAERKDNVIFAMEEPEIALSPHTQRRIVNEVTALSSQLIATSHSPYIAERFLEDTINVLGRDGEGDLTVHCVQQQEAVKSKLLRRDFRLRYAEGLLAHAVLVVEGDTEYHSVPEASEILSAAKGTTLMSLDALGIVTINAATNSSVADVLAFYKNLGVKAFAMIDQTDDDAIENAVAGRADWYLEIPYSGFERMLVREVSDEALKRFWQTVSGREDFRGLPPYKEGSSSSEVRRACYEILKKRKGNGYAALLIKSLTPEAIPDQLLVLMALLHKQTTGLGLPANDRYASLLEDLVPEAVEPATDDSDE